MAGASVTIPFKRDVMPLLDEVAPTAAAAGAVNTIAIRDGRWIGMNTDADGFLEPLRKRLPDLAGVRAVILGAGGAARGVGLALRREGAHVAIAARRPDAAQARRARDRRRGRALAAAARIVGPAGQRDAGRQRRAPRRDALRRRRSTARLVYDLIYDPDPTDLMRAAEAVRVPGDRRPGDARRAGRTSVRDLDRPAAARRALPEAAARRAAADPRNPRTPRLREIGGMKQTTFDEFMELARRGTFVPVVKEIMADLLTPVSAFLKIAEHSDYAFLFESVEGGEQVARYSFLGKDPFLVLRSRDGKTVIDRSGVTTETNEPFVPGDAAPHGGVPRPVRAGAAALHRRRRRLHRLRRVDPVRARARRVLEERRVDEAGSRKSGEAGSRASGSGARTKRGSCSSTPCWRSTTSSTGS